MEMLLTIVSFAFWNRARGSQLFDLAKSTTEGRLLSCFGMATTAAMLVAMNLPHATYLIVAVAAGSMAALMFWCVFAWDNYWSAAIGNPTSITKAAFAPVDLVMRGFSWLPIRLWGTLAMGLRQMLLAPFLIGLAIVCGHPGLSVLGAAPIAFGVPYLVGGYLKAVVAPVTFAELVIGGVMGFLVSTIIQGV